MIRNEVSPVQFSQYITFDSLGKIFFSCGSSVFYINNTRLRLFRMFSKWKRFDVYVKAMDGINQQSFLGAALTLVCVFTVLMLVISEISTFFKIELVSRMIVDKTTGIEAVQLKFDILLHHVSCDQIGFNQEVTRGTVHYLHDMGDVKKVPHLDGCRLTADMSTDKVAGNFRLSMTNPANNIQSASNFSHTINYVELLPMFFKAAGKIPDLTEGLRNRQVLVDPVTKICEYSILVILKVTSSILIILTSLHFICRSSQLNTRLFMATYPSLISIHYLRRF